MRHFTSVLSPNVRFAAVALTAFLLVGCSSSEERAQNYYEHGKQLLAAHDNQRAQIEFLNAVKYNKKLLPAWKSLAQVDELTHNWGGMVGALRNVVELDPSDMDARIRLGGLLLISGNFNEALKLVNDVKEPQSQNANLLALKAGILLKLKDPNGAVTEAQAALKLDPNNTGAMLVLANNDFVHGDPKGALAILDNDTLSKSPDIGAQLFKLRILEQTQDFQQAEALLQKLIDSNPKEIGFRKELIRLYLSQHRNADAEKEQSAIVAADPSNIKNQLDLVQLLNATQGPAAAQQQLVALIHAGGDTFLYQVALAQMNFIQGKFPDAEALLKKLISDADSPDHVQAARINLAEMYLSQKQIPAAEAVVSDILSNDARNIAGLKLRATIRLEQSQFEGAISDLRQALNDQPRATDLMLMLAVAYERSGSSELAEKEFADAMRTSNFNPAVSLNYVAFLQRSGNLPRAEEVLTDLASRSPKDVQVLTALAQVRLSRQEWIGAQDVAEAIKKIGTNPPMADELLGAALAGQNKFSDSITAFQDAYQAAPTAAGPMEALVRAYLQAQKPDQATAFLQSVLKADPSNAEAYVLLGSVQLANKSTDLARQSFMTAVDKQPKNVIGYRALSDFYVLQKNDEEALKVTQAGLKQLPDSFALHLSLAGILDRREDHDAAISEYQGLLAKDPGSIVVANNLASLLADYRTDKASLDQAEQLAAGLQKSPLPQFKDTLGWVDYREGNYAAAIPLLQDAAAALPNVALIHYHLGMSYLAASQPDKATEQFKSALDHAPDPDLAAKIRAAIAKKGT